MIGHDLVKKLLMFDLDARHIQKISNTIIHAKLARECCCIFVFDGIPALQTARKVHRHEPARYKTHWAKDIADRPEDLVANGSGFRTEMIQPLADTLPVVPFLGLYLLDAYFFR